MIRMINGLEPERLSGTVLRFHRGSVASIDGSEIANFGAALDVDTSSEGAAGMAYCGFNIGADYFPYVINNSITGEHSITLSDEISTGSVILPSSDWTVFRKLPWGFCCLNGAYTPGGVSGVGQIPTFHISHWPKPLTTLTQMSNQSNFCKALSNGSASSWAEFPCTKLVPDNARCVDFLIEVNSGTAYIKAGSFQDPIKLDKGQHTITHRITSQRSLFYKTSGGTVSAYVLGYHNTEPS